MDTNKILSADLLDLLFENRNKAYGAYELRKSYSRRITKALLITSAIALLVFAGTALAGTIKHKNPRPQMSGPIEITEIQPEEKKIPEPEKKIEQQPVRTEQYTAQIKIVEDDKAKNQPPQMDKLDSALISDFKQAGTPPDDKAEPVQQMEDKGLADVKPTEDDEPRMIVEVPAKFIGNWEKFLLKNLIPEVPVQNSAPAGRYTVVIQFVVDKEGNVSDIKALTNVGYGMEEEAIRVLRKATKWEPAIQNGYKVKAYRQQPITFVVETDE